MLPPISNNAFLIGKLPMVTDTVKLSKFKLLRLLKNNNNNSNNNNNMINYNKP